MSDLLPEVSAGAATFLGNFTPAIFQPAWFARQKLISVEDADAATIDIIHPEITQFSTDRFTFNVTPGQLGITSKPDAIRDHVRDIAAGIFIILEQTPLKAMGINTLMHYQLPSEKAWHGLGDRLAPKGIWEKYLPGRPGMESLTISGEMAKQATGSKINVKVEPSRILKHGVYFEVNHHFTPQSEDGARQEFLELITTRWSELQDDAAKIANGVIRWASEDE